ncbi:MAG: GNAT family N-acetyltransferase [Burkholderiales bacterium]|nr:GNAT family N-acetyltransferase [Burkholderiales bacterium]
MARAVVTSAVLAARRLPLAGVAREDALTALHTKRLRLEPFAEKHREGLHDMNRKPEVMQFITWRPESSEQTAAAIARVQRCWAVLGTSWWAFISPADFC